MAWFSKKSKRIEAVPPEERVVKTENVFVKCDGCEAHLFKGELEDGLQVCKHCSHHFRIGARERLKLLFDEGKFEELDAEVVSIDGKVLLIDRNSSNGTYVNDQKIDKRYLRDGDIIYFRRVEYDFERAARAYEEMPGGFGQMAAKRIRRGSD